MTDDEEAPLKPGDFIRRGKLRVIEPLGCGGMGWVYKAEDVMLAGGEVRAVKILRDKHAETRAVLERFRKEARIACRIVHPNVVRFFDLDVTDAGQPYIVMEYLEGVSLAARLLERRQLSLAEVGRVLHQLAAGLAELHRNKIVHRDIKPPNLFLCPRPDGECLKVLDFGVAKSPGNSDTKVSEYLGTPEYMSPEQARCQHHLVDARTDVFSTGVLLYQCLAGVSPFRDPLKDAFPDVLLKVLGHEPASLAKRGIAPQRLSDVVMRAIAKEREQRFGTIEELESAFRTAMEEARAQGFAVDQVIGEEHTVAAVGTGGLRAEPSTSVSGSAGEKLPPPVTRTAPAASSSRRGRVRLLLLAAGTAAIAGFALVLGRGRGRLTAPTTTGSPPGPSTVQAPALVTENRAEPAHVSPPPASRDAAVSPETASARPVRKQAGRPIRGGSAPIHPALDDL